MTARAVGSLALLMACTVALPGCTRFRQLVSDPDDIAVKHTRRAAEAAQAFEARRDAAQFMAAQARWREGNLSACREALVQLLSRNPKLWEARLLLAEACLSEEKFEHALEELRQVTAEQPDNARAHHMTGLILQSQGHDSEALACYQRAAELEPDNLQYETSCAVTAGVYSESRGRDESDESPDDARKLVASIATSPRGKDRLGPLDEAQSALAAGDLDQARSLAAAAMSQSPDDPKLAVRAAVLALRHAQNTMAIELLEPVIDRFSDSAAVQRTLGTAYYRRGDFRAAQVALEHAISLDKAHGLTYLLMGCTLEKLGQYGAAKASFEQAGRLDPRLSTAR